MEPENLAVIDVEAEPWGGNKEAETLTQKG